MGTRHLRLPFSAYLKPRNFQWLLGDAGVRSLLPIFEIPLGEMSAKQAIAIVHDPDAVVELSRHASVEIPNASQPMDALLDQYGASELAAFHRRFHDQLRAQARFSVDPASVRIPDTPPCLRWPLEYPNDSLLKPAALQHVARVLTALDWGPPSIAQLIWAVYSRDCNWGDTWARLDPSRRAVFYTRLFTGMIATGVDKLIDMNCVSHQEKGFCGVGECYSNLAAFRDVLLEKRVP